MVAAVGLLNGRPAVGALLGVRHQPQEVGCLLLVANLSWPSGCEFCTPRQPLLPQGAGERCVGLGGSAVPTKVVAPAAIHCVGNWRGEAGGLPGLALGLGEIHRSLAGLR